MNEPIKTSVATPLKDDEESRREFYRISLKTGWVPSEARSTSSRNSRGRK